jgi:hypothetical protein
MNSFCTAVFGSPQMMVVHSNSLQTPAPSAPQGPEPSIFAQTMEDGDWIGCCKLLHRQIAGLIARFDPDSGGSIRAGLSLTIWFRHTQQHGVGRRVGPSVCLWYAPRSPPPPRLMYSNPQASILSASAIIIACPGFHGSDAVGPFGKISHAFISSRSF